MKVSLKKLSVNLGLLSAGLLSASLAYAADPAQITLTNQTSLALATSIAGLPGQPIAPNSSRSANYALLRVGCYYGSTLSNCPITFTDTATGASVATVHFNVETAMLTQAPLFHGTYADEYEVNGWQTSPLSNICIVKKDRKVDLA